MITLFPDKAFRECESGYFDVASYAQSKHCTIASQITQDSEFLTDWEEPDAEEQAFLSEGRLRHRAYNAWSEVTWQEERLVLLTLHWEANCPTVRHWLLADTEQAADQFIEAVCRWNAAVRGEILVFDDGDWLKDERLFQAIKSATFDNLILAETLKQEIRSDLEQFFAARETYAHYHIPWKRGILFLGTPGNGKTHTIKALINLLNKPCLYVKSFKAQYCTDDKNISEVFRRARKAAPCILVLEDLDSLLTDENRSFFLNELDGFASNIGIVILATTNHPERLDPAILDRPSRFDRKYLFNLPVLAERIKYLTFWNASLQATMRLSEQAISSIANLTMDFSFAYLKELFLSSIMRWATASEKDMDVIMLEQVMLLQNQMANIHS
ncbi:MAG TPA: ATP-binding protein [Ktedonobacteraceae bacterium]